MAMAYTKPADAELKALQTRLRNDEVDTVFEGRCKYAEGVWAAWVKDSPPLRKIAKIRCHRRLCVLQGLYFVSKGMLPEQAKPDTGTPFWRAWARDLCNIHADKFYGSILEEWVEGGQLAALLEAAAAGKMRREDNRTVAQLAAAAQLDALLEPTLEAMASWCAGAMAKILGEAKWMEVWARIQHPPHPRVLDLAAPAATATAPDPSPGPNTVTAGALLALTTAQACPRPVARAARAATALTASTAAGEDAAWNSADSPAPSPAAARGHKRARPGAGGARGHADVDREFHAQDPQDALGVPPDAPWGVLPAAAGEQLGCGEQQLDRSRLHTTCYHTLHGCQARLQDIQQQLQQLRQRGQPGSLHQVQQDLQGLLETAPHPGGTDTGMMRAIVPAMLAVLRELQTATSLYEGVLRVTEELARQGLLLCLLFAAERAASMQMQLQQRTMPAAEAAAAHGVLMPVIGDEEENVRLGMLGTGGGAKRRRLLMAGASLHFAEDGAESAGGAGGGRRKAGGGPADGGGAAAGGAAAAEGALPDAALKQLDRSLPHAVVFLRKVLDECQALLQASQEQYQQLRQRRQAGSLHQVQQDLLRLLETAHPHGTDRLFISALLFGIAELGPRVEGAQRGGEGTVRQVQLLIQRMAASHAAIMQM